MCASCSLGPAAENASTSSYSEALTVEQISMLDERFDEFKAADTRRREHIVKDILGSFENTWTRDFEFHEQFVATVSVLFVRQA